MTASPIRRNFAELTDGQIHYAECGPVEDRVGADVVLLLHQTPRSWNEYREVLPILGNRRRAIAMDTIGFGDSVVPQWPGTIERWAAVAVELLDHLHVERADIVGHHTGGVIAVELAASFSDRVRSVVLSSTPYTDDDFRRTRADQPPIDEVEQTDDGTYLTTLWQKRQSFYPAHRPDLLQAFVLDALKVIDNLEYGHRAVATYEMERTLPRVHHPTLIIRALDDPFASPHAEDLMKRLPHAQVVDIAAGMVPLPDQLPVEFAAAVLEFLEKLS